MAAVLDLVNYEDDFQRMAGSRTLILNDLDDTNIEERQRINSRIYSTVSDVYTNVPSCECGHIEGGYNLGAECPRCHTSVSRKVESSVEPLVWIRSPVNVAPFMNIKMWHMLDDLFSSSSFHILHYLASPSYIYESTNQNALNRRDAIISELNRLGITGRGWNYFYENFDAIIEVLFTNRTMWSSGKSAGFYEPYRRMVTQYRDILFTRYLPIPNSSLLVIEESESVKLRDASMDDVIDAIRTMMGVDVPGRIFNQRQLENRVFRTMVLLGEYHRKWERPSDMKSAIWRQHVFGSRCHFAARLVASSITDAHDYECIQIPWSAGVTMMQYHVMNKLYKRKYSLRKSMNYVKTYSTKYNEDTDQILQSLVKESPDGKGIPMLSTRYPVMGQGSTGLFYCNKFKTDLRDTTVGIPILDVVSFNLDFDGDQKSIQLLLDNRVARALKNLAPSVNGYDMSAPYKVNPQVWMPKPYVSTLMNYLESDKPKVVEEHKVKNMLKMFG